MEIPLFLAQNGSPIPGFVITALIIVGVIFVIGFGLFAISRFRRCPSDKILVVYGKVGGGRSAACHHGGAAMVWPIFQDFQYLDLTPMPIDIKLEGALSKQNIRVNTPSTFTVGISTEPGIMDNAAERLLGLELTEIKELAKDIIFGQMRVVIATMDIEEINADRDKLIANISEGVEVELKKVGLRLINVNVQDITDVSGYIDALGQEAASKAINDAKIKVAQADRDGESGSAEARRDQRVNVANADAEATKGENLAAVEIANSNASRRSAEAEAERSATAAEKVKSAQALEEAYAAEQEAEKARARREEATQEANIIVPAEIENRRIETMAEAEAEKVRREKKGEADGIRSMLEAEADGQMAILTRKAQGFREMVAAAGGSADLAALLMATEQLPELVEQQVKAISNLKIDKVTVWDSGNGGGDGAGSTANFMRSLIGAVPPLHEVAKNAGVQLPEYLGKFGSDGGARSFSSGGGSEPPPVGEGSAELSDDLRNRARQFSEAKTEVSQWLKDNRRSIATFDLNDDGVVDDEEVNGAAVTALRWAQTSVKEGAEWYYAEDGQPKGPVRWNELEGVCDGKPLRFITTGESNLWLPFEAVARARTALGSLLGEAEE